MGAYIIRRLLWVGALLFFITALTFLIFSVLPAGDPAALRAGKRPSPDLIEAIRQTLGLDRPRCVQFYRYVLDIAPFVKYDTTEPGDCINRFEPLWFLVVGLPLALAAFWGRRRFYLGAVLAGGVALFFLLVNSAMPTPSTLTAIDGATSPYLGIDFGLSFQTDENVLTEILDRLPATLFLAGGAVVLWLMIGIPIGMVSALRSGSALDRVLMFLALVAISAPVYFFGLVSLYLFSDDIGRLQLLPGNSAYQEATSFFGRVGALFMPWCVLAAAFAAIYARFLRGNLIEVMSEDYIRTARAKGLSTRRVVLRHGVRSALTPIVTLLGLDVGILLGGAILTETVFNIQGVGRFAYDAITRSDLPVIQGTVLFGAFFICIMSLIVDIVYAFLDPRVRYS